MQDIFVDVLISFKMICLCGVLNPSSVMASFHKIHNLQELKDAS